MLFWAKLEASGSSGRRDAKSPPPLPAPRSRSCQVTSLPAPAPPQRRPRAARRHAGPHARTRPWRTHPSRWGQWHLCPPPPRQPQARSAVDPPARRWGCHRIHPAGLGMAGGAPRWAGGRGSPAAATAVPEGGGLTLRSAGNSSFFTSPVAAAMLPAPEKAASPSWDACSFAFSATARGGGARQCPPCAGRGAWLRRREALGRIRPFPPACPGAGEGRGPGRRSAAGHGARAAPQILCCGPCYIRGFSRVTSAPQLAPDLVSRATVLGTEGSQRGRT